MSETTYTFGAHYHSQLIKPHDVIRVWQGLGTTTTLPGYSYFRVMEINNYWAKLLLIGSDNQTFSDSQGTYHGGMPQINSPIGLARNPGDCDTNATMLNIATGVSDYAYPCPYGKGYPTDTYKATSGADIASINFYNSMYANPWHDSQYDKYYLKHCLKPVDWPQHAVYSRGESTIAAGIEPNYTFVNGSNTTYNLKNVGNIDLNLGETNTRYVRALSIEEIYKYFNKAEITTTELANDLFFGKHYFDQPSTKYFQKAMGGWLLDSITQFNITPTKASEGELSYISADMSYQSPEQYGCYINRGGSSGSGTVSFQAWVMYANLREFENWEVVTNW